MNMNNKERLETLRQDLIELVATCARDVRAAIHAPDMESAPPERPRLGSISTLFGNLPYLQLSKDPNYIKTLAKDIALECSHAYALCNSEEALARDGQMLADGMIARWGKAQMLQVMPELIDDPDPAIQREIADFLEGVEKVAALCMDAPKAGETPFGISPTYSLGKSDEDGKLARLRTARKVLTDVQIVSAQTISPAAPSAVP